MVVVVVEEEEEEEEEDTHCYPSCGWIGLCACLVGCLRFDCNPYALNSKPQTLYPKP